MYANQLSSESMHTCIVLGINDILLLLFRKIGEYIDANTGGSVGIAGTLCGQNFPMQSGVSAQVVISSLHSLCLLPPFRWRALFWEHRVWSQPGQLLEESAASV